MQAVQVPVPAAITCCADDLVDNIQDAKMNLTEATFAGTTVGVHSGMLDDLDEVVPELEAQLEAFGAGTERNLLITGHSLGATLSGLSAARLAADGFNVSALSPRPQQADDCTLPSLTFLPILPTFLLRQPDAETEQVDQCSLPGLTRGPAAEPGLCRDIVLPYVERFCDTPFDQLGGKSELQVSLNIFAWQLLCAGNREATLFALNNDPSWCCLFEYAYQLVGGVLEDMLMQVALQHAAPNYLRYADACVSSGDAAEQIMYCINNSKEAAAVLASIEA
ncbi:hypothetical protein COHA_000631 [Chlorella ohadii]|uniref:Fungal lipase-type domain-containing protein n=1 Tax=Chlorella ohadii TaxID=2649997 RepID=A0AAD5H8Y3_9CHLO|nr:hypothetical protein COHA_000631 [Chlorella ohadii]